MPHAAEVIAAVVVAVLALIAFSPGLVGPFLWDDKSLILGNAAVRDIDVRAWFTRDFWDVSPELIQFASRVRYYRPLVTASYALEFRLSGGDPFLFHLTNLVAHALVAVLALFTLRRWVGALVPAALGALFFALHPTKAESVAWIAGRTDVLCALGIFVAAAGAGRRLRKQRFGFALEALGTVIAYLTKEGAIVLPAFVAIEAWVAMERPAIDLTTIRKMLRAAGPQLAIAVAYLVARAVLMPMRPETPKVSALDHAQFIFETIGRYVTLAVAPHGLSGQHALFRTLDGRIVHHTGYVAFGVLALAALVAIAVAARRRAPAVTLAIALFGATLVPVSNLVLTGLGTLVAERFLYLPLLGIAWLVAVVLTRAPPRIGWAVAAPVLLVLALVGFDRALDFSDEGRFWTRERRLHPESLEAHRFVVAHAKEERRYRAALAAALEGREQASKWYRHSGAEAEWIQQIVEIRALLTPDREIAKLDALAGFFRALIDPSARVAELHSGDLQIVMPLGGVTGARARSLGLRSRAMLAALESRLGHDEAARRISDEAGRACPSCVQIALTGAVAHARSGDYAGARAILDDLARVRGEDVVADLRESLAAAESAGRQAAVAEGPVQLHLRATELANLEAYGRAYEVLAPHRAQIELAPGFAIGFAELAFRAGEEAVAREVLGKQVPAERIEPMLQEWRRKMGWAA